MQLKLVLLPSGPHDMTTLLSASFLELSAEVLHLQLSGNQEQFPIPSAYSALFLLSSSQFTESHLVFTNLGFNVC